MSVEVTEMLNTFTARNSIRIRGPRQLNPGERAVIETGIGPFEKAGAVGRFKTTVVAAEPTAD